MKLGLELIFWIFRLTLANRNKLLLENLALRQQLVVQQRSVTRIKLRNQDRFFWSLLSQLWTDWKFNLFIVKPENVVKWHRQGFKLYWRWKSRSKPGRPKVPKPILIIKFLEQEYSLSLYIKGYTLSQMITKVKLWDPSIWYSTESILDINIEVVENCFLIATLSSSSGVQCNRM